MAITSLFNCNNGQDLCNVRFFLDARIIKSVGYMF